MTLDTSGSIPRLRFRNRETYMSSKTAEYDDQVMQLFCGRRDATILWTCACLALPVAQHLHTFYMSNHYLSLEDTLLNSNEVSLPALSAQLIAKRIHCVHHRP